MADTQKWVESLVVAVLSGGGAAVTTVLGSWKEIKGRLKTLEDKLGTDEDPRTGLYLSVFQLREQVKGLRSTLDSWEENPPPWLLRLTRNRGTSGTGLNEILEVEERLNEALGNFRARLAKLETAVVEKPGGYVTKEQYEADLRSREEDSRKRAQDLLTLQRQVGASTNLLRGVMAGLGYLDESRRDGQ